VVPDSGVGVKRRPGRGAIGEVPERTFGLANSVLKDHPNVPTTPGVEWGAVVATSQIVVVVLAAIGLGAMEAVRRRNELFGYRSRPWSEAALMVLDAAKRSLPVPAT
jgi:hypothetical protein